MNSLYSIHTLHTMITAKDLLVLPIVVPILTALLIILQSKRNVIWAISTIITVFVFALVLTIVIKLPMDHAIRYNVGGWKIPIGIGLGYDTATGIVLLLVNLVAVVDIFRTRDYLHFDIMPERSRFYSACQMLVLGGFNGMIITNDLFNIYVFTEVSSLATYIMVGLSNERKAQLSAFNYLVLGTIAATCYVLGLGYLYALTGTLNMDDMRQLLQVQDVYSNSGIELGFALIIVGWVLKVAWYPLHSRTINVYSSEPASSLPFLGGISSKVPIYALLRLTLSLFGVRLFIDFHGNTLMYVIGTLSVIIGGFVAIRAKYIRAGLAWSSLSQLGFIALGISLTTQLGLQASFMHMFAHGLAKSLAFMSVLAVCWQIKKINLQPRALAGIAWKSPVPAVGLLISVISLFGMPGTSGFVSKWTLLQASMESHRWDIVVIIIIGSLLAVGYSWNFTKALIFEIPEENTGHLQDFSIKRKLPIMIKLPIIVMSVLVIVLGFNSYIMHDMAMHASIMILGN